MLKNKGYAFEQEVRIAFAVEAASAVHHFEVDPKQLIRGIVISSRLFLDEQVAVKNLIETRLEKVPIEPLGGFSADIGFLNTAVSTFRKYSSPFRFDTGAPDVFKKA